MNLFNTRFLAGGVALSFGLAVLPAHADYHIVNTIRVGGDGGWDYLEPDPVSRRLYVTHKDHVVVLDMDTLKVIGDIPDSRGSPAKCSRPSKSTVVPNSMRWTARA
jgi:hypothetical protein